MLAELLISCILDSVLKMVLFVIYKTESVKRKDLLATFEGFVGSRAYVSSN